MPTSSHTLGPWDVLEAALAHSSEGFDCRGRGLVVFTEGFERGGVKHPACSVDVLLREIEFVQQVNEPGKFGTDGTRVDFVPLENELNGF